MIAYTVFLSVNSLIETSLPSEGFQLSQQDEELEQARRERDLARLDLEWETDRKLLLNYSRQTPIGSVPNRRNGIQLMVAGVVFHVAIFLVAIFFSLFILLLFVPLVMLMAVVGVLGYREYSKAIQYELAHDVYHSKRQRLNAPIAASTDIVVVQASSNDNPDRSDQIARARIETELAKIDLEWEIEKEKRFLINRRGQRSIPDRNAAFTIVGAGFGLGTIFVISGPKNVFCLIGIAVYLLSLFAGIYIFSKAREFEKAKTMYEEKRRAASQI